MEQDVAVGAARKDARRAERRKAGAPSTVRSRGIKPIDVTVEDISRTGIRFVSEGSFGIGDVISIGLAGVGTTAATVAWARGGQYGCAFVEPIAEEAVARAFASRTVVQWAASPGPGGEAAREQVTAAVHQLYGRHRYWAFPPDVFAAIGLIVVVLALVVWRHFAG